MDECKQISGELTPFILSPESGSYVDYQEVVRIAVPDGLKYLRLFVYSDDNRWYLQAIPSPTVDKPKIWEAVGTFGHPDSAGKTFKLLALVTEATPAMPLRESDLPVGARSNAIIVSRHKGESELKRSVKADRRFQILIGVSIAIFSAIVGAIISNISGEYSGRIRQLPYLVSSSSGIITKPELVTKNLKILLDNKPVSNVSSVTFVLYNNTDQDYNDVGIRLMFEPINGKSPILVQSNIQTPKDAYEKLPSPTTASSDNTVRLGYNLYIANRSVRGIFIGSYLFEGDRAPGLQVYLQKKGVESVEIDPTQLHSNMGPVSYRDAVISISAMAAVGAIVFFAKGYRLVIFDVEDRAAVNWYKGQIDK